MELQPLSDLYADDALLVMVIGVVGSVRRFGRLAMHWMQGAVSRVRNAVASSSCGRLQPST